MLNIPSRQRRMTVSSFFVGTIIENFGNSPFIVFDEIDSFAFSSYAHVYY